MLNEFVDNMRRTFLSFLFPPRCVSCNCSGVWLCRNCMHRLSYASYQCCVVCGKPAIGGYTHPACETRYTASRGLSAFEYQEPLREAIHNAKYRGTWGIFMELVEHAVGWLDLMEVQFLPDTVLVPVPLHYLRKWERGYNQSHIIAKYLAKNLSLPFEPHWLVRTRYTKSQALLSKEVRHGNVKGAFQCTANLRGKNILLVDDVFSTGATLRAAAKELKKRHARTVWCFTIARS